MTTTLEPKVDAQPVVETAAAVEVAEAAVVVPETRRRRAPGWWPVLTLGSAVGLWIVALARLNADAVGPYGLVSAFPIVYFAAIGVLSVGFIFALHRGSRMPVLLAHIAVFIIVVHATPAIAYGALRYAWAWKHVGIVDLLHRHHALVPSTPVLPIYQQWPGFFAAATALTEAGGIKSAVSFAAWAPPVFELLDAAALVFLFRGLTDDRRRIALGVWLFLIANWIGQDYFAPQAFGFFLFLVILAIVLRWYRRPDVASKRFRAKSRRDDDVPPEVTKHTVPVPQRRTLALLVVVLMAATVTSHPLTPLMLTAGLAGLTVFRVFDRRWPAIAMFLLTGFWLVTGGHAYTFGNFKVLRAGVGKLGSNVNSNLVNVGKLSPAQHVVANMGRIAVVTMALLALFGMLRRVRRGHFDRAAVLLCIAPVAILAGGSYGGEAIFRVYLFALPFAAFLAAGWFYPDSRQPKRRHTPIGITAVSIVLVTAFMFSYFGKEAWSHFTPGEVRASDIVFSQAPPNSLLIAGTLSYPTQFKNAENFTYVTISNEPLPSIRQVLADPASVLATWMSDPRYAQGYVIITRSQTREANGVGVLPRGALGRVESALLASKQVKVLYHDDDALLVTVVRSSNGTGATTSGRGETP
jgi:hypothetical protein